MDVKHPRGSDNNHPAAAICYMDESLDTSLTLQGKHCHTRFDRSGIKCGPKLHFSTIRELTT
jgi:hypothetical protein